MRYFISTIGSIKLRNVLDVVTNIQILSARVSKPSLKIMCATYTLLLLICVRVNLFYRNKFFGISFPRGCRNKISQLSERARNARGAPRVTFV